MKLSFCLCYTLLAVTTTAMDLQKNNLLNKKVKGINPETYSITMDNYPEYTKLSEKKVPCCTSLKPYCPRCCTKFKDCCACTTGCCCGCAMTLACIGLSCKFKIPLITWIVKEILSS